MVIFVNDNKRQCEQQTNVEQLLAMLNIDDRSGMAVAINDRVVPKNKWQDRQLTENDNVLIIRASQGG
jgi:sulfur carrier protein